MTALTLHTPDELSIQADQYGLLNKKSILQTFCEFLKKPKEQKPRVGLKGVVKFMAEDFNVSF